MLHERDRLKEISQSKKGTRTVQNRNPVTGLYTRGMKMGIRFTSTHVLSISYSLDFFICEGSHLIMVYFDTILFIYHQFLFFAPTLRCMDY